MTKEEVDELLGEIREMIDEHKDISAVIIIHDHKEKRFSHANNMCIVCAADYLEMHIEKTGVEHSGNDEVETIQ